MSDGIEAKVLPMMLKPLVATEWKGRIRELTERRVAVFEAILPFRISASIKRHQSAFLMQSYKRMLRVERQGVEALLPEAVLADPARANAVLAPQFPDLAAAAARPGIADRHGAHGGAAAGRSGTGAMP